MFGLKKKLILANGSIIKCLVMGKWFGKMEEAIKATILEIKCMVLEFLDGLTGGGTKVNGRTGNSTEKETIF